MTRIAGAYAVAGWLLAQVAVTLEDALELPGWFDTAVVLLLLIAFPLVVVLAWMFDITSEGIQRTAPASGSAQKRPGIIDVGVIVALLAILSIVGYQLMPLIGGGKSQTIATDKVAPSIAVLPFSDMSDTGDQEYFSDGLAEEILNVLAQVDGLQVASRTSSFSFKDSDSDITRIARLLNVQHVLEGSVRKAGNTLRITAQLIRATDGFHVWSQTYDRELDDVFAIQDDISRQILTELRGRVFEQESMVAVARTEITAYDLVLRAKRVGVTYSIQSHEVAAELCRRAIDIDPTYARAYTELAAIELVNSNAFGAHGQRPIGEVLPVARELLDKALELAPTDPEVWLHIGTMRSFAGEFAEAETAFLKAQQLQPNVNLTNYTVMLNRQGRLDEAIDILEQQQTLNPRSAPVQINLLHAYLSAGQLIKAREQLAVVNDYFAGEIGVFSPEVIEARLLEAEGRWAASLEKFQEAYARTPQPQAIQFGLGTGYVRLGDYDSAMAISNPLVTMFAQAFAGDAAPILEQLLPMAKSGRFEGGFIAAVIELAGSAGDYAMITEQLLPAWPVNENLQACNDPSFPHPWVVTALRDQEQNDSAEALLECWNTHTQGRIGRGYGDDALWLDVALIEYFRGNTGASFSALERHFGEAPPSDPFFLALAQALRFEQHPRGKKLVEFYRAYRDSERAKLGLPPLDGSKST